MSITKYTANGEIHMTKLLNSSSKLNCNSNSLLCHTQENELIHGNFTNSAPDIPISKSTNLNQNWVPSILIYRLFECSNLNLSGFSSRLVIQRRRTAPNFPEKYSISPPRMFCLLTINIICLLVLKFGPACLRLRFLIHFPGLTHSTDCDPCFVSQRPTTHRNGRAI